MKNILLFMTDQQRADTVPPFSRAITPNLNRFAEDAVSFTDVLCVSPHCCPSRTTLFSGLYPSQHGVWNNVDVGNTLSRGMAAGVRLWPEDLREAGYRTYYSGKWHLSSEEGPEAFGFERLWHNHSYTGVMDSKSARIPRTEEWEQYKDPSVCREGDERANGAILRPGYPPYSLYGEQEHNTGDENTVNSVADKIREVGSEPWFIFCGPIGPHDPYFPPKEFVDLYDLDSISLPDSYTDKMLDKPAFYRKTRAPFDQLSEEETREGIRHYLAYCSYEDMLFGRILQALRDSGQYDNTIIIYASDHGDYNGEHGLWAKGLPCFRGAYNVPLLIHVPGGKRGCTADDPAVLADIGPTILDLAGLPHDPKPLGQSLKPYLFNGEDMPEKREYRFTMSNGNEQYGIQRAVWGKDWKYVYNGFDYDELYDLRNDPQETRNVIDDPANREIVRKMCAVMWQFVKDSNDTILNSYILSAHAPYGPGVLYE